MFEQNCTIRLLTNLTITLLLTVTLQTALAQEVSKKEAIDQIFSKYHEYEGFQGAVLVAEKGEVIYKKAFGLANREWNIPNQVDSRFDIASVSKQFTAMLVMQMYEEGKIHPDSTISSYYPEYRPDIGQQVTIHHLLTHRSGIPNYTSIPYVWSDSLINRYSQQALVEKFCSGDLEYKPGSRYNYNNTGYFLLSVILEKVSGRSYAELLQEKILSPLNMQQSGVDVRDLVIDKRSYGYVINGTDFENARPMYMANLQGAGNMYATVDDLYRWDRALYKHKLLSRKGLKEMMTPHSDENDTWIPPFKNAYGYGVGLAQVPVGEHKDVNMVFHSGHITGYSSFMARFTDDEHLVVMLSNMGNVSTARMNEITQEVKNVLYNQPYKVPERTLRSSLFKTVRDEGVEAALAHFNQLILDFPYEYRDTEEDLHQLGLLLASNRMKEAALQFFKLNAQLNPGWRSFQTLADAFYEKGNYGEAGRYYKKSMTLNPKSTEKEKNAFNAVQRSLTSLNQ